MDNKEVSAGLKVIAKDLSTKDEDLEKEKQLTKEVRELMKKLNWKDPKGFVSLEWSPFTYVYKNAFPISCSITGKWISNPEELKYYADIYAKADKAYQDGKKKLEEFAKKNNLKVEY